MGLSIVWAVATFIGKTFHDNRQLEIKRPSWSKVAVAAVTVLPILLGTVGGCYWLGNRIEQFLARKIFQTEVVLMKGVDQVDAKVDELTKVKGRWWDPREWFFYSFVRHYAQRYGQPAVAETATGITLFYGGLRSLYRALQYVSVVGLSWVLVQTFLFAACRSFLYGGGAFMFHLPATPFRGHST
jgi:hypothetical protein